MSTMAVELSKAMAEAVAAAGASVVGVGRGGSGVVVAEGLVVTNAHNVRDSLEVHFEDGSTAVAGPAGVDMDGDLAVVAVPTAARPTLALEPAEPPALGNIVIGLARPRGTALRVGVGFVTGLDVPFGGPRGHVVTGALEHSAALPHGSSGGPLIDARGRLVGINTHREGDGFYLALPVTAELKARVEALARGEVPRRARLGVALAPPRAAHRLRQAVGLPERQGLLVQAVADNGPAARAGVRRGDLIVSVGGHPTSTVVELAQALEAQAPGTTTEVAVVRGTDELTLSVSFAEPAG